MPMLSGTCCGVGKSRREVSELVNPFMLVKLSSGSLILLMITLDLRMIFESI